MRGTPCHPFVVRPGYTTAHGDFDRDATWKQRDATFVKQPQLRDVTVDGIAYNRFMNALCKWKNRSQTKKTCRN